ncbi:MULTISPECIES: hypothetical protein [Streptomyces]|uniref:hypothetical protein n=1 Tax=Streptomyces TaxID=1883 RepID=UPI0004BD826A|nr:MULTISPECIES: hypothetical protein [Streptomyces]
MSESKEDKIEPIDSKYDEDPLPPPEEGDGEEPEPSADNGKDLSGLVPKDEVAWDEPPSFNKDPQDIEQSQSDGPPDAPDPGSASDLKIDLASVRTTEESMLTEARTAVAAYEELRSKVLSQQDTVFGQGATVKDLVYDGPNPGKIVETPHPFATSGEKFADEMNPAMERALLQVGTALEKLGEYIALINHSGQVYAHTDRESRFPDPPAAG